MQAKSLPSRLRREDSFLGIHFDFHATDKSKNIGNNFTPATVEYIIKNIKPDFIQCDCKGHPGFSSYPTKVGTPAPHLLKDMLKIWRDVTAKYGVALYTHYSGVWDSEAVKRHPSWARVNDNGKRDKTCTSVFGPYVDKLLIPQIKEVCDVYGVDGVWIDGDCWAMYNDYNKNVLKLFKQKTGITKIPRKPEDPYFFELLEFCRQGFRDYVNHYATELHRHNPDFQVCSNWSFTSFMPGPVVADVDFLSGDYMPLNSVNSARIEARCLVHQGKPWDLMAWGFNSRAGETHWSTKSVIQMQREAAVTMALGGGYQCYFPQKKDGSIVKWQMDLFSDVAAFCRKRQEFCHKAKQIPQVALLYSSKAFYRKSKRVFQPWDDTTIAMNGILQNLLDSQNVVDITMEHQITGRMSDYSLIVIPEWDYLEKKFKEELLEYVKNGGNLLVVGPSATAMFAKQLGIKFIGKPEQKDKWLFHNDFLCGLKTVWQEVKLMKGVEQFGKLFSENDSIGESIPAASIAKYGKGKIAGVYTNLGERYCKARTFVSRHFLGALVRKLFAKPLVEVSGSHLVDVTAARKDGKLMINLINTAGPHSDMDDCVFDEIPPIGPLNVLIRTGSNPRKITLQPDNVEMDYKFSKGEVKLTLPQLKIHEIIVVEY